MTPSGIKPTTFLLVGRHSVLPMKTYGGLSSPAWGDRWAKAATRLHHLHRWRTHEGLFQPSMHLHYTGLCEG